jgi:hypothetical protein
VVPGTGVNVSALVPPEPPSSSLATGIGALTALPAMAMGAMTFLTATS